MSSNHQTLALLLDAVLQSWGSQPRLQYCNTADHPTKSGIGGMLCAAMGIHKGSPQESEFLQAFSDFRMITVAVGGQNANTLIDFQVARGGIKSERDDKGGLVYNKNAVLSHRFYLANQKFGVFLVGPQNWLTKLKSALENPVWGFWYGRKCCIPSCPPVIGIFDNTKDAWLEFCKKQPIDCSGQHRTIDPSASYPISDDINITNQESSFQNIQMDVPVSFGKQGSSSEGRVKTYRTVYLRNGNLLDCQRDCPPHQSPCQS